MSEDTAIDRLYLALGRGDVAAARQCFVPDARIWHNFDGLSLDVDAAARGWEAMVAHFPESGVEDVRRQTTATGFVQQHFMVMRTASGERKAWPVCVVVQIRDDLIARFDEYIDRAGSMAVPEGPVHTPGFSSGTAGMRS